MNKTIFNKLIVGNTVIGITRFSKSPYMLYFSEDGQCDMWKEDRIYEGKWWYNEEKQTVHARWPNYVSKMIESQFYPNNPLNKEPTSVVYYYDPDTTFETFAYISKPGVFLYSPVRISKGKRFPKNLDQLRCNSIQD
jgi:hypothetical protein